MISVSQADDSVLQSLFAFATLPVEEETGISWQGLGDAAAGDFHIPQSLYNIHTMRLQRESIAHLARNE